VHFTENHKVLHNKYKVVYLLLLCFMTHLTSTFRAKICNHPFSINLQLGMEQCTDSRFSDNLSVFNSENLKAVF